MLLNVVLVLAVLKKNYTNLCHCLPQNDMQTINKLRQLGFPDEVLNKFTNLPTTDLFHDKIVGCLMAGIIKSDVQALEFCDVMDNMTDSESSKTPIEILRNGN